MVWLHAIVILTQGVGDRSVSRLAGFIRVQWACQYPVARRMAGPKREISVAAADSPVVVLTALFRLTGGPVYV